MAGTARRHDWTLRPMQPNPHYSNQMARQKLLGKSPSSWPGWHDTIPSGKDTSKPAWSTQVCSLNVVRLFLQRKAGQHSGYRNFSIHTLHIVEILQQANGDREEEARTTTLCMAWHAQQETSSCATIPTDTGWRGHSASTTNFVAGGVAIRVQYKQGQTAKER